MNVWEWRRVYARGAGAQQGGRNEGVVVWNSTPVLRMRQREGDSAMAFTECACTVYTAIIWQCVTIRGRDSKKQEKVRHTQIHEKAVIV